MIPEPGIEVSLNGGEELLTVVRVENGIISLSDNTWMNYSTWNSCIADGLIKLLERKTS